MLQLNRLAGYRAFDLIQFQSRQYAASGEVEGIWMAMNEYCFH